MNQTARNIAFPDELVGWTPESNDRGSWNIIVLCLKTIVICTWTVLHPRVHVGRKLRRAHKACQFIKQVVTPELVTIEAIQEFIQIRKMIACCSMTTKGSFTQTQAFYIGMMGLRYRVGDNGGSRVLWSPQYAYLLNTGLAPWPPTKDRNLCEDLIQDKSKADGLLKLVALWQIIWFTANCIARRAHSLELAPLESMTLAYVVQFIITYVLWWKKPKDIATATFIDLPTMSKEQRRQFDFLASEDTYDTPDPAMAAKPSMNVAWYNISRDCTENTYLIATGCPQFTHLAQTRIRREQSLTPGMTEESSGQSSAEHKYTSALLLTELGTESALKREDTRSSDAPVIMQWDDVLYMTKWWPLVCLLGVAFGAVHMISWNARFPTRIELWLWRASALGSIVSGLVVMHFRRIEYRWQGFTTIAALSSAVIYVICRLIMVAETIAAFRAMPRSTYQTYEIMNYWFHFF